MLFRRALVSIVAIAIAFPAAAQVNGLGEARFENSGAPEAQEAFLRGLLLLHSFEYEDSREAFAEAQKMDPDFAMAYWGEAMAYNHPIWFSQNTDKARAVLEALGATLEERLEKASTEREKDYLRAVEVLYYGDEDKEARDFNYMQQMEQLAATYPEDLEAKAFYALSLLGCSHGGRDFTLYMKAAAVGEEVFARNSKHPGAAHYLIHSYDDPVHAPLGLRAAYVYADIAPSAAHALHMPSHIFTAMGMWDRVVQSNIASYDASEQRRVRKDLGLGSRSYHAIHWMAYGLLQQRHFEEAKAAVMSVKSDYDDVNGTHGQMRSSLAMMRAAYLVDTGNWDGEVAHLEVDASKLSRESRANHLFINGMIALKQGDSDAASRHVKKLMDFPGDGKERTIATILQHSLKSLLLIEEGLPEEAVKLLRSATELEAAMPFDFGPPSPVKPSYELLGEVLLHLEDYEGAMEAFEEALARAPKRTRSLQGLADAAKGAGDAATATRASHTLKTNQVKSGGARGSGWQLARVVRIRMSLRADHMRKAGAVVLCGLVLAVSVHAQPKYEFRAAWIATVANLDWPNRNDPPSAQQSALLAMLDKLHAAGINAVFFQIRSEADAMYDSALEPWSYWLTGKQGAPPDPYYDPLAFAVEAAHERGMELHAWFNPYRVRGGYTYARDTTHVSVTMPELLYQSGSLTLMDPGKQAARDYITRVIMDVARHYDVDGIHFDDYFYPYPPNQITTQDTATFNAEGRGFTNIRDWRRDNVNVLVAQIADSLRAHDPLIKWGISPFGIYRNNVPEGIVGLDAWNVIFADPLAWLQAGTVDYIVPQLYWPFGGAQDYMKLARWWVEHISGRQLYIGHGLYRADPSTFSGTLFSADEIPDQIQFNRGYLDILGSVFFRAKNITQYYSQNIFERLRTAFYPHPSTASIHALQAAFCA